MKAARVLAVSQCAVPEVQIKTYRPPGAPHEKVPKSMTYSDFVQMSLA